MDARDRVLAALHHKEADRVPITDNPWFTAVERWRREGLPQGVEPRDLFDFDGAFVHDDLGYRNGKF